MSIYVFRTETATLYIRAHVSPGVNTQFPVLITRPTGVLYLQILHPHLFIKADILARVATENSCFFFSNFDPDRGYTEKWPPQTPLVRLPTN